MFLTLLILFLILFFSLLLVGFGVYYNTLLKPTNLTAQIIGVIE